MTGNQNREASPFAALTFQEQQDRWRAWRSRQLEFKKAADETSLPPEREEEPAQGFREKPLPPSPVRHGQLDRVLNRHQMALKKAGKFTITSEKNQPGQ